MRAFVTGATGFVGGHLAEHLLAEGDRVTGCSRRGVWPQHLEHLARDVRLLPCDLSDPNAAGRLFAHESYDCVFHLAGLADPRACERDPALARRQNADAMRSLCEAIRLSGQRPRVLLVSTSYVYGQPQPEDLPVTTACPIRAEHPYAASKWAAEESGMRYVAEFGLDIVRVRPFNHTGPRQPLGYVVPDWASQVAAIEAGRCPPVLRVGSLDTRRDYTDVRDVVRGYRMLIQRGRSGEVYNLGSGVSRSGREIVDWLLSSSSVAITLEQDPPRMRGSDAPEIVADIAPLQELTGWKPQIDLHRTLGDTLDYWRVLV